MSTTATATAPSIDVTIVHGGELARDVAQRILAQKPSRTAAAEQSTITIKLQCASKRPQTLIDHHNHDNDDDDDDKASSSTVRILCFVVQTIENGQPTEEGSTTLRFFKRQSHSPFLMKGYRVAVLGLGDSNLLLDRQTTSAKDCNEAARQLEARLVEGLGATRLCPLGMADERTGLDDEVEPWIKSFWNGVVETNDQKQQWQS